MPRPPRRPKKNKPFNIHVIVDGKVALWYDDQARKSSRVRSDLFRAAIVDYYKKRAR